MIGSLPWVSPTAIRVGPLRGQKRPAVQNPAVTHGLRRRKKLALPVMGSRTPCSFVVTVGVFVSAPEKKRRSGGRPSSVAVTAEGGHSKTWRWFGGAG
jgi:hypothetical protein